MPGKSKKGGGLEVGSAYKMKYQGGHSAFPFKSPLKDDTNPPHKHPHIKEFITHGSDTISSAEFDAHVAGIRSGEIEVDESKKLIKHKIIGGKGAE